MINKILGFFINPIHLFYNLIINIAFAVYYSFIQTYEENVSIFKNL